MAEHNTDYEVFADGEICKCPVPDGSDPEAARLYEEQHPEGEGLNWCGIICHNTPLGVFCRECSEDSGDWVVHIIWCPECGYEKEDNHDCRAD